MAVITLLSPNTFPDLSSMSSMSSIPFNSMYREKKKKHNIFFRAMNEVKKNLSVFFLLAYRNAHFMLDS